MEKIRRKAIALEEIVKIKSSDNYSWSSAFLCKDINTKKLFRIHKSNAYCNVSELEIFIYEANIYPHLANFSARKATGVYTFKRSKKHSRDTRLAQFINRELYKFEKPIYYRTDKILRKLQEKHFKALCNIYNCETEKQITNEENTAIWADNLISKVIKYRNDKVRLGKESLYAIYGLSPRSCDNFYL